MDSELRAKLKRQIQAYMEKKPCAELSEVTSWLKNDNNLLSGVHVNSKTIKSFTFYQIKKFKCENLNQLKREITRVWRDLDADKSLHARLMKSIPDRCRAVVASHGAQIV